MVPSPSRFSVSIWYNPLPGFGKIRAVGSTIDSSFIANRQAFKATASVLVEDDPQALFAFTLTEPAVLPQFAVMAEVPCPLATDPVPGSVHV